jgi:hypothetical protein
MKDAVEPTALWHSMVTYTIHSILFYVFWIANASLLLIVNRTSNVLDNRYHMLIKKKQILTAKYIYAKA